MSRDKRYQRLLNSPRWREVKTQVWRRANGLCERCIRDGKAAGVPDGYITPGVDCHHIKPVESGRTVMEMEQLCFNPANIELLCVPCHIKVHQDMRTHTKEKVKANKQRARQRFMELNDPNYQPPEKPKPYGQQADEYLKNLEERARQESKDPNYKAEDNGTMETD